MAPSAIRRRAEGQFEPDKREVVGEGQRPGGLLQVLDAGGGRQARRGRLGSQPRRRLGRGPPPRGRGRGEAGTEVVPARPPQCRGLGGRGGAPGLLPAPHWVPDNVLTSGKNKSAVPLRPRRMKKVALLEGDGTGTQCG